MADAEVKAGQRAAEMESMKTASRVAKVRAGMAARGVDIGTGSAVDVQASEREVGKIDAETALSNAQLKAYGYRSRSANYGAQAGLYDAASRSRWAEADDARTGSYLRAGGTLLSSASSLPSSWTNTPIFGSGNNLSGFPAGGGPQGPSGGAIV
jgi:hypothetical protein